MILAFITAATNAVTETAAAVATTVTETAAAAASATTEAAAATTEAAAATADTAAGAPTIAPTVSVAPTATMFYYILLVAFIVVAIGLITVILLQKKRTSGLGNMSASANTDTYWGKNKGRSMEGTLERYTKILGSLFFILAIVIGFVS